MKAVTQIKKLFDEKRLRYEMTNFRSWRILTLIGAQTLTAPVGDTIRDNNLRYHNKDQSLDDIIKDQFVVVNDSIDRFKEKGPCVRILKFILLPIFMLAVLAFQSII